MVKIKKKKNPVIPPNDDEDGEKVGSLIYCQRRYKVTQLVWKTIWQFLKKQNMQIPYVPAFALLGVYSREMKTSHKNLHKYS